MAATANGTAVPVTINPLLKQLEYLVKHPSQDISTGLAEEIALAISHIFTNELSPVQTALLLHDLYYSGLEQHPAVLKECAKVMTAAAALPDPEKLRRVIKSRGLGHGRYQGGLCDIVGTGGDHHSTFNISTASSIIASTLLLVAKHGNRASTSRSGSSDVLSCMKTPEQPMLARVTPEALPDVYASQNYGFLFAPNFHKGLVNVAGTRKQLHHPTIFNLLGPLTNPADVGIEARMIGVKKKELVPVFAQALKLHGVKKGIVACGDEDLDEISCASPTHCAWLVENSSASSDSEVEIKYFQVTPEDFGVPRHALADVGPGKSPEDNAEIMRSILAGEVSSEDPILHFVLINTACFFVVSGVCEGEVSAFGDDKSVITERGPGGGRWKEGARLARQAVESGRAWEMLKKFTHVTNTLEP